MNYPEKLTKEDIAYRASIELPENSYVNLGIGLPSLCAKYLEPKKNIIFQAENGILGFNELSKENEQDENLIDAGGQFLNYVPGISYFDSADSFAMIRGGHIDITVLGGLQVSENGDLANWMIKSRGIGSIGGAMDLVTGAREVIVTMEHITKDNKFKILKNCDFPLTGVNCVNKIITDIAVIEVREEGMFIVELAKDWSLEQVQSLTEPKLIPSKIIKDYVTR
jgi:3-oxoacid CoA-transferase subunit B